MNASIQKFISGKRIALAGASRSGKKFGNAALKELTERGYEVSLIHPEATVIDGQPCYPSLSALPEQVDGVLVVLPPLQAADILRQASACGLRNVWIQQGGESPELIELGQELNLDIVTGKCIMMYAPPVRSFHSFHRFFVKLAGQY